MQPAPNAFKTITYMAAPGDEATVHPLEVTVGTAWDGVPVLASCWEPSDEEIAALQRGEKVWLTICGRSLPPACLTVGERPFFLEEPE